MVKTGPDTWRSGYGMEEAGGLCPRGGMLGELLGHRLRILTPGHRVDGSLRQVDMVAALKATVDLAGGGRIVICLDGNLPAEEIAAAVAAVTGGADILRVHDVGPTVEALKVIQAIGNAS